jgi:Leucine-rich repeat (LRR) protein
MHGKPFQPAGQDVTRPSTLRARWTSTRVVQLLALVVLAMLNVPGQEVLAPAVKGADPATCVPGSDHIEFGMEAHFEHGWPATYLWRGHGDIGDERGCSDCWLLMSRVERWSWLALTLDACVATLILFAVGAAWEFRRRSRRRVYQFYLSELLGLFVVASVFLSWLTASWKEHEDERKTLDFLDREDYGTAGFARAWPDRGEGGPTWLRPLIGDRCFRSFDRVVGLRTDHGGYEHCLAAIPKFKHLRGLFTSGETRAPDPEAVPCLEALELRACCLDDAQVAKLRGLRNLRALALAGGNITDEGLGQVASLTRLRHLDLYGARLSDVGLAHISRLADLESLCLSGTPVTDAGLKSLSSLHTLRWLGLRDTRVTAAGLAHLEGLTGLEYLLVDWDKIGGAGLVHLRYMAKLRELDLSDLPVTDEQVAILEGLRGLRNLNLWRCSKLTDAGLAHVGRLGRLEYLTVGSPNISDAGMAHLAGLANLIGLSLANTPVTDIGLEHLTGLTGIRELDLPGAKVTGDGLRHLSKMTRLRWLDLQGTPLLSSGLGHLKKIPSLRRLDLSGTKITDEGLANLSGMPQLLDLNITATAISDAGLAHLARIRTLQVLRAANTKITAAGVQMMQSMGCNNVLTKPEEVNAIFEIYYFD